ncbi:MAG: tetratricopeptide repeat protein [Anaerolineae bacterium]|nr:tetratricopeptide repeat protein [Anaerolineae bacterium]
MATSQKFGELLSQAIWKINLLRGNTGIQAIQDNIGYALGRDSGGSCVAYWRKGNVPKPEDLEDLARELLEHGGFSERRELSQFLVQGKHPDPQELCDRLWRDTPTVTKTETETLKCHNLPPRYGDFLGRDQDIRRVTEGLASRWPMISIEGLSGVGKSTLAIEIGYRCLLEPTAMLAPPFDAAFDAAFDAVVWISAQHRPEQPLWLQETLNTVARVLEQPLLSQLAPEQKWLEVEKLLRTQRVLVIVDNFETMEDRDLERWIESIPEPSKVILTTRHGKARRAWDVHLRGLAEADALLFIEKQLQRIGLPHKIEDAGWRSLVQVTDGNPKAIEMALGYLKHGVLNLNALIDALHTASQSVGRIFDDLFQRSWGTLSADARAALWAMSFFADTVSQEALGATAGLGAYHLHTALEQLTELALLEGDANLRYSMHPLTRAFVIAQLRAEPEWESAARERWIDWYTGFLATYIPQTGEYWSMLQSLDIEVTNLENLIQWTFEKEHALVPLLAQRVWYFLYIRGEWVACERYVRRAIQQAAQQQQTALRLWLEVHLARLLVQQANFAEAEERLLRAEAEINALNQVEYLVQTNIFNRLAQLYLLQGNLDEAERYGQQALALSEQFNDKYHRLRSHYRLGQVQLHRGQWAEAEHKYRELLVEARHEHWERQEGYCKLHLAIALIALARLDEAATLLTEAVDLAGKWKEPLLEGKAQLEQAILESRRGNIEPAGALARSALTLFQRFGDRYDEIKTADLLARLKATQGSA